MKKFIVDTFALNIFIVFTAIIIEIVLSGIPWSIFWKGRLIMILPNTITVVPYNRTRDWLGNKLVKIQSLRLRQITRDTLTFVLYRVPLIFIVLILLGTPIQNVIRVCIVATLVSGFTGRPYGIFLDWMRKVFNTDKQPSI